MTGSTRTVSRSFTRHPSGDVITVSDTFPTDKSAAILQEQMDATKARIDALEAEVRRLKRKWRDHKKATGA